MSHVIYRESSRLRQGYGGQAPYRGLSDFVYRESSPYRGLSLNRVLISAVCCVLMFASVAMLAAQGKDATAKVNEEVLKANTDCNAAELRGDVAAMDACETDDFTHTHASGQVEHKAKYLKGVGSGAHKFLTLDLSELQVRSYGTSAIVEGHIHLRADNLGKIADVNNQLMTVWVKQQGKWREAAWIAVGLPASRPAAAAAENK